MDRGPDEGDVGTGTVGQHAPSRKGETLPSSTAQMDLEDVTLLEQSEENVTSHRISLTRGQNTGSNQWVQENHTQSSGADSVGGDRRGAGGGGGGGRGDKWCRKGPGFRAVASPCRLGPQKHTLDTDMVPSTNAAPTILI